MRIAVACNSLAIAPHFAQATSFVCYTVEQGRIIDCRNMPICDQYIDNLTALLNALEVDILITNKICGESLKCLTRSGIQVVTGFSSTPVEATQECLASLCCGDTDLEFGTA